MKGIFSSKNLNCEWTENMIGGRPFYSIISYSKMNLIEKFRWIKNRLSEEKCKVEKEVHETYKIEIDYLRT